MSDSGRVRAMEATTRHGLKSSLAEQILADLRSGHHTVGDHLSAQVLADRYGVSRSPVTAALRDLAASGLLRHQPGQGYFVLAPAPEHSKVPVVDPVRLAYRALAEDRLAARVPDIISINALRERYGLSRGQVQALVTRVAKEGWLERRAGYGLAFTPMLGSADALFRTYRFRMAIEPAALLEPGYELDRRAALECWDIEQRMLAGGIETMDAEALYERGVRFHEVIVAGSRNAFFLDALRRINSFRRLLAYRASATRARYYEQAKDHLEILDLLEAGRNAAASERLRDHLERVIRNLAAIRPVLDQSDQR
jgi:DNA-binding GntR family transcriptional regulator